MATSNINVSVWRGSQVPPTIYHKWIKLDEQGNYIGDFIYKNGEWISILTDVNNDLNEAVETINNTITEVKTELQTNIDTLEEKHDADKLELTDLINAETERATNAESELNTKIEAETTRATQAESDLNTKIEEETNRAQQAENQIQYNVNLLKSDYEAHKADTNNPHEVTKEQVGLGNVTNDAQVKRSEMGQPNGVATLDNNGKIPSTQLNGQLAHVFGVDGVALSTTLPTTGLTTGDIYWTSDNKKFYNYNGTTWDEPMDPKDDTIYNFRNCDKDGNTERTNILYRWDGKDLVEISESIALGETVGTAYYGEKGAANRQALESLPDSIIDSIESIEADANSVSVNIKTASKNGLNYNPVEDVIKNIPVATDTQAGVITADEHIALNTTIPEKLNAIDNYTINGKRIGDSPIYVAGDNITLDSYTLGTSTEQVIPTDTVNEAIGKLQLQINDNLTYSKETLQDHISDTDNPHHVTKEQLGLEHVDNTSDLDKPISKAVQEALNTKQPNLVSGTNIKTVNGESIVGSGDIDFKTINGQELTGTGTIDFRPIQDVNGVEQSPYGTDVIETLKDAEDAKVYGRSNGSWIDLTPYLTWYIE